MHYLFPFFKDETQGKLFVTFASLLMLSVGVLNIAYAARNINLFNRSSSYNILAFKDPLVGYYMFYGIQSIFTWRSYNTNEESEPNYWANFWVVYFQACLTMAAGVGTAGSKNRYAPFIAQVKAYQLTPGLNPETGSYLESWVNLYQLATSIIIITFIISVPLITTFMYGLTQKLRSYRVDRARDVMHNNPELQLGQSKPTLPTMTKL